ncbi:MAG: hypothetical protein RLZZ422_788 [Pseudomonadota bacterium]
MSMFTRLTLAAVLSLAVAETGLAAKKQTQTLRVTATAYNAVPAQTDETPDLAAWGDRLTPNMKAIAVSRDLLQEYGLKRNSVVRISGLPGEYRVLDKMHSRWNRKIDIFMGKDQHRARRWGRRNVTIQWK